MHDEYAAMGYQQTIENLQEAALKEIDGAIFKITMLSDQPGVGGVGTGFSPAPGQLLTNMHVIQPPRGGGYLLGEAEQMGSGGGRRFDFTTFLGADEALDTALLRIPEGFEHTSIPFTAGSVFRPGTQTLMPGLPERVENILPGIVKSVRESVPSHCAGT